MLLQKPLKLKCGLEVKGRVAKAAMTEGLADEFGRATQQLEVLYSQWSKGQNAGHLLITGNIVVDRRYVERPGNVCIDGEQSEYQMEMLRRYAAAAQQDGTVCIVQLSHAGRQCNALVNTSAIAPSAIRVVSNIPTPYPREMTSAEINDVVDRFVSAAKVVQTAGFSGVQIHSAHGYLLSSFLSPLSNERRDEYGGSLENRARLLLRIIDAVRAACGASFCVAVKLNSSDFQKGGFKEDEAVIVAEWLEKHGVDFLEISGGNYENPAMMMAADGFKQLNTLGSSATSTQLREGYFLVFAQQMKKAVKTMPLMVTGGFRSKAVMETALMNGDADLIGIARPVCGKPDCVASMLADKQKDASLPRYENDLQIPWYLQPLQYVIVGNLIRVGGLQMWYYESLIRLGNALSPQTGNDVNLFATLIRMDGVEKAKAAALKGKELEGVQGLVFGIKKPANSDNTPLRIFFFLFAIFIIYFAYTARKK